MIKKRKLDCGVLLVTEHIDYVQSAAFGIWTKTGSVNETKKTEGISHLIEHMLFKGTEKRNAKQIAQDVDKIGSNMNAFTSKEATCYYIKSLASNIDKSIDILMDMFLNSLFDREELEKEKQVIYEEMKMVEDTPDEIIHDMICELALKGTSFARPVIGTRSSVSGITRNAIKKYIKDEYTRDNIVIAVAGNIDEEVIASLIDEKLRVLGETKEEKELLTVCGDPSFKVKLKDVEQSHICLGKESIELDNELYYALAVLNNILGGTMSSRLFQSIREEKGLAYSVYSMNGSFVNTGIFNIYAAVSHEKAEAAVCAMKEELDKLRKYSVTTEEMNASKEQLKGSYIFSQESVNGRMFSLGKNMVLLNKIYLPEEIISGIDKVSLEDIEEASKIINDFGSYSGVLITNKKKADLQKWMQG